MGALRRILRIAIALSAAVLAALVFVPQQELECGLTAIHEADMISTRVVRTACLKEFEARGYDRAKAHWFPDDPHTDVSDAELAKWAPELEFKYNNVSNMQSPIVGYTIGLVLIIVAAFYLLNAPAAPLATLAALGLCYVVFASTFRLEFNFGRDFGEPIYLEGAIMPLLPLSDMQIRNLVSGMLILLAVDFVGMLIRIGIRMMRKAA